MRTSIVQSLIRTTWFIDLLPVTWLPWKTANIMQIASFDGTAAEPCEREGYEKKRGPVCDALFDIATIDRCVRLWSPVQELGHCPHGRVSTMAGPRCEFVILQGDGGS